MAALQRAMEQPFSDSEVSDPSSAYLSNMDEEFPPCSTGWPLHVKVTKLAQARLTLP